MSSHFDGKEAETKTDWTKYFRTNWRPTTYAEQRFTWHMKLRAGAFVVYLLGFIYYNPEYSYTMTYINNWLKERRERLEKEEAERVTPPLPSNKPIAASNSREHKP